MKATIRIIAIACGLAVGTAAYAAPPADAPSGSTGLCKDGTYYNGATKKGACKGHNGVKEWWGGAESTPTKEAKSTKSAAEAAPAAADTKTAESKSMPKPAAVAAAGGGPGKVWVNPDSKVYHCPGDRWYGKTKQGEYLAEADATAKGHRPDHGKACK